MKNILVGMFALLITFSSAADELPFDILVQDESVVEAVRAEDNDVWIRLSKEHVESTITVKISSKNGDFYRNWFTGSTDMVSSGYRGTDTWSDRVQTTANFIEYWKDGVLVLHLQRK